MQVIVLTIELPCLSLITSVSEVVLINEITLFEMNACRLMALHLDKALSHDRHN